MGKYLRTASDEDSIKYGLIDQEIPDNSVVLISSENKLYYDPEIIPTEEKTISVTSSNISDTAGNPIEQLFNALNPLPALIKYSSGNIKIIDHKTFSSSSGYYFYDKDNTLICKIRFYEEGYNDRAYCSITGTFIVKSLKFNFD